MTKKAYTQAKTLDFKQNCKLKFEFSILHLANFTGIPRPYAIFSGNGPSDCYGKLLRVCGNTANAFAWSRDLSTCILYNARLNQSIDLSMHADESFNLYYDNNAGETASDIICQAIICGAAAQSVAL